MKNAVIVLGILSVLLLGYTYLNRGKARQQAEESAKEIVTLSNKLVEVQTRLVMHQALATDAQTNLHIQLEKQIKETAAFSNRLAQISQLFNTTQKEAQVTQAELEAKTVRLADLESEMVRLNQRLDQLKTIEKELAELKSGLSSMTTQRNQAIQESQRFQVEKGEIENKFNDLNLVRLQLKKLEDEAKLSRRLAQGMSVDQYNRSAPLALESDGTVKLLPPNNPPSAKNEQAGQSKVLKSK